jgi:hypothetical protein
MLPNVKNAPRALLIIAFLSSACRDGILDSPAKSPTAFVQSVQSVRVRGPMEQRTIHDELADVADTVPGFAGLFFNADGSIVGLSARSGSDAAVGGAVTAFLARHGLKEKRSITVQPAKFDYRQLRDWAFLVTQMPRDGVIRSGVDVRQNVVHIGVIDQAAAIRAARSLAAIGVPADAAAIEIVEPNVVEVTTLKQTVEPVRGALQIGFPSSQGMAVSGCSLAIAAVPQALTPGALPDYNSTKHGVTASHCTANFGVKETSPNNVMGQPFPTTRIGVEEVDPPTFTNAQNPQCPIGRQCRYSDAVQVLLDSFIPVEPGTVYDAAHSPNPEITGTIAVQHVFGPFTGFAVRKVGMGTGGSNGTVGRTCQVSDQFVRDQNGVIHDTGRTLLCQSEYSGDNFSGDSGAPILWNNGTWSIIGIYTGGNNSNFGEFSDWNWAWQELRQSWDNPPNRRLCPVVSPGTDCLL